MSAALLLIPAVVVSLFVLLLATTWLESFIALRRSDSWPLLNGIDAVRIAATATVTTPTHA